MTTLRLQLLDGVRWEGHPVTGERQQRLLAALVAAGGAGATVAHLTARSGVTIRPTTPRAPCKSWFHAPGQ